MNLGRERLRITIFNQVSVLTQLRNEKIKVYNWRKVDDFKYEFSIDLRDHQKAMNILIDAEVIEKKGPLSIAQNLFLHKTTLLAVIFSLCFFFFISERIYQIEITGNSRVIDALIISNLDELGIKKYNKKPSFNELLQYETTIQRNLDQEIEFIEMRLKGVVLVIRYTKRRTASELPIKHGPMHAKKNGIIAYFVLSSGEKLVEVNDYVVEGQLLVNDVIITPKGEEIKVGTEGQVYAYTWTVIEVSLKKYTDEEESELYLRMLTKSEELMTSGFYLDEKIISGLVLSKEIVGNVGYLKIHYTCLEDIAN